MRTSPFVVSVADLRKVSGQRRRERRSAPLPGLAVSGSAVPEDAEVTVDVVLEAVAGGVVVTGTVSAPWTGPCRRCLGEATNVISSHVREVYEEDSDLEQTYLLRGDQVDLEPLARDAVLLELPQAPLCREDCAGICPTCGAERNVTPCGCAEAPVDPRWAALDVLGDNPEP